MTAPAAGGHVTQDYGVPGDYAAGYHTGRDWAGGDYRIVATRAGTVTFASWAGDYGLRVEIVTDGIQHSYSHLATITAWVGQQVVQGQQVGWMGSTGNSRGDHVHYEERTGGHTYNENRRPVWDVEPAAPIEPPPLVEEDEDMTAIVIVKKSTGAAYLIDGKYKDGIYDVSDVKALQSAGIPVAYLTDKTYDDFGDRG